jgi:peptidyl-dipeptidase A
MSWKRFLLLLSAVLALASLWSCSAGLDPQQRADQFLQMYDALGQKLYTAASEADWKASTDVSETHTGERIGAEQAMAAFSGSRYVIEHARSLLDQRTQLDDLTVRQLDRVLLSAAEYPGTIPEIVAARVEQEAKQSAILDGFEFCADRRGEKCVKTITPNEIDNILVESRNDAERRKIWEVSKQSGPALKPGLIELRRLRNETAKEMGYSSFFGLQVADYGMTVDEMMKMMEGFNRDLKPLYEQVHGWAKYKLAERYKQPVPKRIPAQWIGNRWAQAWPGLTESVDLDALFKDKSPQWIVEQAERFYTSLGMPELPESFWQKSDLYQLPPGATRKKNTHASAWHIDLDQDVRSLMSVEPNFRWFQTAHHELGHIYYFMAYTRPEVPLMLREGANRAFHEAVGDLIGIAAHQPAYLKEIGILDKNAKIDEVQWLLDEALDEAVVFIPFSAGTMSFWEHDLYEEDLSPDEFNKRWWDYAGRFQGIEPPSPRGEEFCDACTKTHISDDPAQYYDYAMAFVIKYQLHTYIAKNILKQDPRNCNYYGNKQIGEFLSDILRLGATRDWREVIREKTGEEISTRAMLEYFSPLMDYLKKQNQGRDLSW